MKINIPDFPLVSLKRPLYIPSMPKEDKKTLANVVFPLLPLKELTYLVPSVLSANIRLGHRVVAPVGHRKECGFVISFQEKSDLESLKSIEDLAEPEPLFSEELITLVRWISEYYMVSPGEVVRAMLPSMLHRETRLLLQKIPASQVNKIDLTEKQMKILQAFQDRDTWTLDGLQRRVKLNGLRLEIGHLKNLGLLSMHYILDDTRAKPKLQRRISIKKTPTKTEWQILQKQIPKQAEILMRIMDAGGAVLRSELDVDFSFLKKLEDRGWISMREEEIYRDPYHHIILDPPKKMTLTEHQSRAVTRISHALDRQAFFCFLLHGVTASGKTQVYIEIIRKTRHMNKTALILIPEISLTPQAVQRYRSVFGKEVAILHSRMSDGERFDSWRQIREGHCPIALGPRSAIFAPLKNIGVIIVDEEHDASYKQNDPSPRYNARDLAVMRAKISQCTVILGSATPSFESYANAMRGKYTLCHLPERIDRVPLPHISLVDRSTLPGKFKRRVLSPMLLQKMEICFSQKEQTILLQNRRGYATYLRCQACGTIETCTNCDITLTYHLTDHMLRCHLCGYQRRAPSTCSKCNGPNLRYRGAGTQKVEEEIQSLFPNIRCLRMDMDTTRTKHAHSKIITAFEKHEADILLGTQMVAKGHDFPGVSLVGIVSADTGLLFPDFRAEERTFQMLIQAAGRAGRRNIQGEVVIQTFYPEHPIFKFILNQDYESFYKYAMEYRTALNYPPHGKLIAIRFRGTDQKQAENAAHAFSKSLPESDEYKKLGPVASPIAKKKGQFLFQIILRSTRAQDTTGRKLRLAILRASEIFRKNYHFPNVRIIVDVDPIDLL